MYPKFLEGTPETPSRPCHPEMRSPPGLCVSVEFLNPKPLTLHPKFIQARLLQLQPPSCSPVRTRRCPTNLAGPTRSRTIMTRQRRGEWMAEKSCRPCFRRPWTWRSRTARTIHSCGSTAARSSSPSSRGSRRTTTSRPTFSFFNAGCYSLIEPP